MKKMIRDVLIMSLLFVVFVSYVSISAQERKIAQTSTNDSLVEDIEMTSDELVILTTK